MWSYGVIRPNAEERASRESKNPNKRTIFHAKQKQVYRNNLRLSVSAYISLLYYIFQRVISVSFCMSFGKLDTDSYKMENPMAQ